MLGPVQGADEIVVDAPPARIFQILEDTTRLPEWTSVLTATGTRETPGAVRECEVQLGRKRGHVTERCIESDPSRRIAWALERDTFGFSRMMSDFGFSFTLTPTSEGKTVLRNETYYRTRGLLSAATNHLVIRRKFRGVRRGFLAKLKRLSEQANAER